MPFIGNVTHNITNNYNVDGDKLNNIHMALNTLREVVDELKNAVLVTNQKLDAEILQIDAKFRELLERIQNLDNSDEVLAVAEDLRTSVLSGINALGQSISNIIPDNVDENDTDPTDSTDGENDEERGEEDGEDE